MTEAASAIQRASVLRSTLCEGGAHLDPQQDADAQVDRLAQLHEQAGALLQGAQTVAAHRSALGVGPADMGAVLSLHTEVRTCSAAMARRNGICVTE